VEPLYEINLRDDVYDARPKIIGHAIPSLPWCRKMLNFLVICGNDLTDESVWVRKLSRSLAGFVE
jgi:hypothetical protein